MAAVTIHKRDKLTQQKFILLLFGGPKVLNWGLDRSVLPLEAPEENLVLVSSGFL